MSSLIGARVWVKVIGEELRGIVESVPKAVPNANWQEAINLSTFSIRLENAVLLQTLGSSFSRIDEKFTKSN